METSAKCPDGSCRLQKEGTELSSIFVQVVSPEQAQVLEQEVRSLLVKEAIERVPLPLRDHWFYSQYFTVPKKDGGLHLILDLQQLNCTQGCTG